MLLIGAVDAATAVWGVTIAPAAATAVAAKKRDVRITR
jgi:hypothetical protein